MRHGVTRVDAMSAAREALEVFQNREAYKRDVEKDVAKRRESATVATGTPALTREAVALRHQSDSNRAPLTDNREFAPAFGSLGRGQAATNERMSAPTPKVRTTPESGAVAAKPIDAYVLRVDPQASFTPENTYFREDRVKQVVGVKLRLKGAVGFAKPGMPADGEILVSGTWPNGNRRSL